MPKTDLSKQYQKKTDKQHVLDNPDTYIGSIEKVDSNLFVYDTETKSIQEKQINIIPGLYKLFDEGIVNCRDHAVRMANKIYDAQLDCLPVSNIEIDIDEKSGEISMKNDGNGIDIAEHPEYKVWIPELIFGHLRTSTNYDKTEKKIVGGKNGFGFKLVLIWSTWGRIETVDHTRGLKYIQEFKNNLDEICKPTISKCKGKPYTKISFIPDYARLKLTGLDEHMISLFKRRVYDVAAITNRSVNVKYNSELVPIKNFQNYVDMYIGSKSDTQRIYEEVNKRWEYAVCLAPKDEFTQVSFVNGIFTSKGGKHVEYILNQIIRKLSAYIKTKKHIDVKATSIKEQLMLFLRCDIENPSFDSQTKDYMNTPISSFGSTCSVSDKFIEKIAKMGVMNAACSITEIKDNKTAKKTDGSKVKSIRNIPKLIDANFAGTDRSSRCTIIFCEGDSAKAGIVSGLSKEDRDFIGVYPMKGKLFNVRGETQIKIAENKEIAEIKQILGLETGMEYTRASVDQKLRYGKVLFMTDQDLDGSHIKGLGLNLFDSEWKSLTEVADFIGFVNTPILKARKNNKELLFYNEGEYEEWKKTNELGSDGKGAGAGASISGWKIKYYKGLGTSTAKEFKEYFANKKEVLFDSQLDKDTKTDTETELEIKTEAGLRKTNILDMIFNKKRSEDRKKWLKNYNRDSYLDTNNTRVSFQDFINKELIHFSKYDCDRSIPNLMDGLKISQRKILFAAFKKNLRNEIKVAQFSGYVSEHSGYHHGESSLNGAIINMAQNFVGSNNINLFQPNGQFGTRLALGQDSASERYIFTQLNPLSRTIFRDLDDKILRYLDDDGMSVEPIYYAPIIPMILVNGSKGIGTGFSTDIMSYNPIQIISYIQNKLQINGDSLAQTQIDIEPYYEGFKGKIIKINDSKYLIKGNYSIQGGSNSNSYSNSNWLHISELPIGTGTDNYKQFLEGLIDVKGKKTDKTDKKDKNKDKNKDKKENKCDALIKDYIDSSTDTIVDIKVQFYPGVIQDLESQQIDENTNELEKYLKLFTTQSTTNMHLFDAREKLQKFEKITDIIDIYFERRLEMFKMRKEYQLKDLKDELLILSNKAKYIQETLDSIIDLRKKSRDTIDKLLEERKFAKINDDYKYLIKMPMDSVSQENVEKLLNDKKKLEETYNILKGKKIGEIWYDELEILRAEYLQYKNERIKIQDGGRTSSEIKKKKLKIKGK
jgi:DNA topoisomerase II